MAKNNYDLMQQYDNKDDFNLDLKIDDLTFYNLNFDDLEIKEDKQQPDLSNYDAEKESKEEIGEVLQKIKDNEKKYRTEIAEETENDFYFSVIFRNRKELHEFLNKYKLNLHFGNHIFFEDLIHILKEIKDA